MADKRFSVLLADPPWHFQNWGGNKPDQIVDRGRGAQRHYPTMSNVNICLLPVESMVEENAALFLWACWPLLPEALRVIEAWGFEYKSLAWVWVKARPSGFGFHFGMGYYTRANTEPCLLAVRGKMPVVAHDVQALIYSPVREHSRKPNEQYQKIERLCPDASYLEMFARRKPLGNWSFWGNEIESDVEIAA